MKKYNLLKVIFLLLFILLLSACSSKKIEEKLGEMVSKATQDVTKEMSEKVESIMTEQDPSLVEGISDLMNSGDNDLPVDFPTEIPMYDNANIIEAERYGDDGYTLIYSVNEDYDNVLYYYIESLGLDDSLALEEESYFEDIQIDQVHIKGMTITDDGDMTMVFMTIDDPRLLNQSDSQGNIDNDVALYGGIYDYDLIEGVAIHKDYPEEVLPLFPEAKVIDSSFAPSGSGYVDLVIRGKDTINATQFYEEQLGVSASHVETANSYQFTFNGEKDGYQIIVTIYQGDIVNGSPVINIMIDK